MLSYQALEDKVTMLLKGSIGKEVKIPSNIVTSLNLSSTKIKSVDASISKHHNSKTDVLVTFEDNNKLKISIKKNNADYYGNWYTHQRIKSEFGVKALNKLTTKTTEWANRWVKNPNSRFFLGVSINFGERSGNTFMDFNEVFNSSDIRTIAQGHNLHLDTSANVLLQTNGNFSNVEDVIKLLKVFDQFLLNSLFKEVKIVFRPINPMTEGSNRGKQTYTKYVPNSKFTTATTLTTKDELIKFGHFKEVNFETEFKLNHNRLIKNLKSQYNMQVNVK